MGISPLSPDLFLHSPLSCGPTPSPFLMHTCCQQSSCDSSPHVTMSSYQGCMNHDVLVITCLYYSHVMDISPSLPLHQSWVLQCRRVLTLLFASGSSPCRGRWGKMSSATLRGTCRDRDCASMRCVCVCVCVCVHVHVCVCVHVYVCAVLL